MNLFLGVDIGTGSLRVGIFNQHGQILDKQVENITTHNPRTDYFIQSSTEIWAKICAACREIFQRHPEYAGQVKGIGFDATCSLVCYRDPNLSKNSQNFEFLDPKYPEFDIILWMDHRAKEEADFINSKYENSEELKTVGGKINLEMQTPKLLLVVVRGYFFPFSGA